ncbi:MAG: ABC transporter substrate-binding protein [Actinomycetota bacterium]
MMEHPPAHPLRSAIGLVLAAATLLAACDGSATTASPRATQGHFDQTLHDRLPPEVRARGFLRVGTDASYAPMESFAPDGRTIIGIEPDLALEIGRILGVRLQFVNKTFDTLREDVADGVLDLAMSAMTDTPERAKAVDFVDYFSAGTSILVQRGNPSGVTGMSDLCGKVAAVESGTTQMDLLARTQKNCGDQPIIVKSYPTNSDALVQLRTGRAAAALSDFPTAAFFANDPHTRSHYQLASTTQFEPGLYGIAVAKTQPSLREAVQGACEELLRSGIYNDVMARWDVSEGGVDRISINSDRWTSIAGRASLNEHR